MSYQISGSTIIDDSKNVVSANTITASSVSGGFIATSTEAELGESNNVILTPLALRSALRASGSAPVAAARAWFSFSATTPTSGVPTIIGSENVSSITDLGLGYFKANLITAMPVTFYPVVGSTNQRTDSQLMICIGPMAGTFTSTSFEFRVKGRIFNDSADYIDPIHASFTVFA